MLVNQFCSIKCKFITHFQKIKAINFNLKFNFATFLKLISLFDAQYTNAS